MLAFFSLQSLIAARTLPFLFGQHRMALCVQVYLKLDRLDQAERQVWGAEWWRRVRGV